MVVRCVAKADIPVLTSTDTPVAIAAKANPALTRYPEPCFTEMTWKNGPGGLIRDVSETRLSAECKTGPLPDADYRDRGVEITELVEFTDHSAKFICRAFPGHAKTDPVVNEADLADGVILEGPPAGNTLPDNLIDREVGDRRRRAAYCRYRTVLARQ